MAENTARVAGRRLGVALTAVAAALAAPFLITLTFRVSSGSHRAATVTVAAVILVTAGALTRWKPYGKPAAVGLLAGTLVHGLFLFWLYSHFEGLNDL